MSHAHELFRRVPARVRYRPHLARSIREGLRLLVKGQGVVSFTLKQRAPFSITFTARSLLDRTALRWEVDDKRATLWKYSRGESEKLVESSAGGAGLDPDPNCPYWFSFDGHNRRLAYGKGESRVEAQICLWEQQGDPNSDNWLPSVDTVELSCDVEADIWRDPIVNPTPLAVLPADGISMDDVASSTATVAANLTAECQRLYANVAGTSFQLDTPDFPDFSKAIERSIRDPNGWCYKKLKEKASEFGKPNPDETYLRITLGCNQGESPGVPFVMEIWPPGHYSPIHNHGESNAIIKVLHGAIHVSLFRMLSPHHRTPMAEHDFKRGDVTWISPRLNQIHQLMNISADTTCVTIQCYTYSENDRTHYEYFDYINGAEIDHFAPNSDMDFQSFKKLMKAEWHKR